MARGTILLLAAKRFRESRFAEVDSFGCEICWPESAEAAWDAQSSLSRMADLIDESHYHVMLLDCPHCSTRFMLIFTETIDWVDGEDPQYWTVVPVTGEEAVALIGAGSAISDEMLYNAGAGRKSLRRSHPKGEPPSAYWRTGVWIGRHD